VGRLRRRPARHRVGLRGGRLSVIDAVPRLWSSAHRPAPGPGRRRRHRDRAARPAGPRPAEPHPGRATGPARRPAASTPGIPMGVVSAEGRWLRVNHA
jgi:hypothetical protein